MATEAQTTVAGALTDLGFERVEPKRPVMGGPQEFRLNEDAAERLAGKTVTVDSDGSVRVG